MQLIDIQRYKNPLPAIRAVEILRNQGVAASATQQFAVCVPNEAVAVGAIRDILQPFRSEDYDFSYNGPRPRQGMAFNIVEPAIAQMLATLLDQAAVLAALGSLYVHGGPAAPLFGGLAQQIRDQSGYPHPASINPQA